MVNLNFDARTVEPAAGFDPVPAGWYKAMIDDSGPMTPAKSNPSNAYLPIRFTVVEGQYKNKKVFVRLNIVNANQQAQEIAFKELSAIAHAVGVLMVETSEQLHNKPLWIKVKVRKGGTNAATGEEYNEQNEITSYKDINFVPPADAAAATVAAPKVAVPPPAATFPTPTTPAATFTTSLTAPVAPPVIAMPTYEMAPGETFTREQYNANGWTDEMLIQHGKMRSVAPSVAPPPPPAPAPPPAPDAMPWANAPQQPWAAPAAAGAPPPAAVPATPPPPAAVAAQAAPPPWSKPAA